MLAHRCVFFDAQGSQNPAHQDRGIPRYTVEQIAAVLQVAPEIVHSVAVNPRLPLPSRLDFLLGTDLLEWSVEHRRPSGAPPAIYHVMSPFELERPLAELWPAWARGVATKTVATLFDLIPLIFADHYLASPVTRNAYLARANLLRSADHVLAISQTSAADAFDRLGLDERRVTVIDAGVNDRFAAAYDGPEAARSALAKRLPHLRSGFMLYVGGIDFRKNIERLLEGYALMPAEVRARHQLVVACRVVPADRERLERLGRELGLREHELVLSGYVTDPELAALYHLCELFVFASFYEGSGLPILEAMACDAPVAASNASTSPEILGDLNATFDPHDPQDIADVLARTIEDAPLLERLRERSRARVTRYTWRHVAEQTIAGYEAALRDGRRRPAARAPRPRIAWYSPWPPDASAVASHSRRLLQALGHHADIDVVVANPVDLYPRPLEEGVRIVHVDDVDRLSAVRLYDRHVYCMGNSSFHRHVYEALLRLPGVVLAHDVRLVGFYRWYAAQVEAERPYAHLARLIRKMYGGRVDADAFRDAPPSPQQQEAEGLFMSQEIQHHAESLIVHSRYAADILRLDRPPERRDHAPIAVLPHGVDPRPDPAIPIHRREPLVVSLGVLAEIKGLAVLLDAFALVAQRHPSARLCLAGPAPADELERWRAHARDAGIADRVDIPGFVDAGEYERLLSRAALAIQLRLTSNGEASGAVADALGAALPTIATAQGWTLDLPDDALVRVPRDVAPAVLASEIDELLSDPDRRIALSAEAKAYAAVTTYESVAERYLDVLDLRSVPRG